MRQLTQVREVIGSRQEMGQVLAPALYGQSVTVTSIRELPHDQVAVTVAIPRDSTRPQWTWGHLGQLAGVITALVVVVIFVWAVITLAQTALAWASAHSGQLAVGVVSVVGVVFFLLWSLLRSPRGGIE